LIQKHEARTPRFLGDFLLFGFKIGDFAALQRSKISPPKSGAMVVKYTIAPACTGGNAREGKAGASLVQTGARLHVFILLFFVGQM
jgi:hypothetical protein